MALTISNAGRKAALDGFCVLLNAGQFRLLTSGDVELGNLTFSATAFAGGSTASPSVAVSNSITADNTVTAGDIGKFDLRTSGGVSVLAGTVGVGSGDFQISSVTVPGTATSITCTGGLQLSLQLA